MCRNRLALASSPVIFVASLSLSSALPNAHADGPAEQNLAPAVEDGSSPNFQKSEQFLPGEEVVTPTGQKMKVWSTNGPVAVDRAPEPFEDREKALLNDTAVVVDPYEHRDDHDPRHPHTGSGPHSESTHDR